MKNIFVIANSQYFERYNLCIDNNDAEYDKIADFIKSTKIRFFDKYGYITNEEFDHIVEELSTMIAKETAEQIVGRIYECSIGYYNFAETFRRILGDITHTEWWRVTGVVDTTYLDVVYNTKIMSYEDMIKKVTDAYPNASLSTIHLFR